jgi:hypothetical protein
MQRWLGTLRDVASREADEAKKAEEVPARCVCSTRSQKMAGTFWETETTA